MLLYSLFETTKNLIGKPIENSSMAMETIFSSPMPLGLIPGAKEVKAFLNLTNRIHKSYIKPEWKIDDCSINKKNYTINRVEVLKKPFGNLLHFKKEGFNKKLPTLLIVAPMSGHYPTLLRETVRTLLPDHDVFITEWVNARDVPIYHGEFSLDDYVRYLMEFSKFLKDDGRNVHVLSICQPTVPSLVAQSLMAQRKDSAIAKSMIMVGGPVDARKSPTAVTNFALERDIHWFEQNLISMVPYPYKGAGRMVYPGFLQHFGFVAMNPNRHADAHNKYFKDLTVGDESSAAKHREFYDEYNAVMDLPRAYYLQTIKKVFQDFDLPLGKMFIDNQLVEPQAITDTALLTIEGELDDISGAGQTHFTHELCSSIPSNKKEKITFEGVGHYGVFSGSKFREKIAPFITEFIKKND